MPVPNSSSWLKLIVVLLGAIACLWFLPALAQKCIQSGYLPEEGAIECHTSTIVRDAYYAPSGTWVTAKFATEAQAEAYGLAWALELGCTVRTYRTSDWYYLPWAGGTQESNGEVRTQRIGYKDFRSDVYTCSGAFQRSVPWGVQRISDAMCPGGHRFYEWHYPADGGDGSMICGSPRRLQCARLGNPLVAGAGVKTLNETHLALDPATGLRLAYHYNSGRQTYLGANPGTSASTKAPFAFADRVWRHNFERALIYDTSGKRPTVRVVRPAADQDSYFVLDQGQWKRSKHGTDRLSEVIGSPTARWEYRDESDTLEYYNDLGQLVQTVDRSGRQLLLNYTNGRLSAVHNEFGHLISFEYSADGLLTSVSDSSGQRTNYAFDATWRTLQAVTFPGGAVRRYHYEAAFKHMLTGITDELGVRYATYAYDVTQRPVATEHAGGVNKFSLSYTGWPWSTPPMTVTGPTGATANISWRTVWGATGLSTVEVLADLSATGPGLERWWQQSENDANGNITMRKDFAGVVTRSTFDLARNLETRRIDNADTTSAQTNNTQYHPDWNLPVKTAGPNLLTTILYNGQVANGETIACAPATAQIAGKPLPAACWIIEQPTLDANGSQGFAAAASGNATVTRAAYNGSGQMLLFERYDNVPPTTAATPTALPGIMAPSQRRSYVYAAASDANYTTGDLQTLTLEWPNQSPAPAPQTTTFRKYNKRGQVLEFQSADGAVTTLTYAARGWLTQHRYLPAGGNLQVTNYEYDAAGQLKKATLPDLSFVTFSYDDAQRLTGVADSAGCQGQPKFPHL